MSTDAPSQLEILRDRCTGRIGEKPAFAGVPALSRKKGDLLADVMATLALKNIVIIVTVSSALPMAYATEQVVLDPVNVLFEISENVRLNQGPNGTQKGAMYVAERIAAEFQMWSPWPDDPLNGGIVLMPQPPGIVELPAPTHLPKTTAVDPAQLYILAVHFKTQCTLPARVD